LCTRDAETMTVFKNDLKRRLPLIEGVGPSSQWLPPGSWTTVFEFLLEHFPSVAPATWASRMQNCLVIDQTGQPVTTDSPYRVGACIYYYRELEEETPIPFVEQILYEDEHILVADKPHFLSTAPAGRFLRETLLVRLRNCGKPASLVPLHRLDRETAGVVLFSVNPQTRGQYTALFRERRVRKMYEALAASPGEALSFPITRQSRIVIGEPFFRMKEIAAEPNAETQIELKATGIAGKNIYCLRPTTGKKHQLRLHLAALGIPIVNDRLYPSYTRDAAGIDDFSRPLKLLAKSIAFRDPVTGREMDFESKWEL